MYIFYNNKTLDYAEIVIQAILFHCSHHTFAVFHTSLESTLCTESELKNDLLFNSFNLSRNEIDGEEAHHLAATLQSKSDTSLICSIHITSI
jgi:hypothetical protein